MFVSRSSGTPPPLLLLLSTCRSTPPPKPRPYPLLSTLHPSCTGSRNVCTVPGVGPGLLSSQSPVVDTVTFVLGTFVHGGRFPPRDSGSVRTVSHPVDRSVGVPVVTPTRYPVPLEGPYPMTVQGSLIPPGSFQGFRASWVQKSMTVSLHSGCLPFQTYRHFRTSDP